MKLSQQLLLVFCFIFSLSFSQSIERIQVKGQIIVDSVDKEGVTVYNLSANTGTVTDENGTFSLAVTENDRVEVSALQFEKFNVTITSQIIEAKSMTIFLIEKINTLDEIILLPYGLTGNLEVDLENTKTKNPNLDVLYFGLDNMEKFEFPDDYKSGVRNIAMRDHKMYYTADFVNIVGTLLKPIFKDKSKQKKQVVKHQSEITQAYSVAYLLKRLNIPEDQIDAFIDYVDTEEFDKTLLDKGKELEFLDYLITKSKSFQKLNIEKD
ncbi:carboxypeptidase-like regulatory domain-containing protein [Pontimicrobium sp. IMCC45349]|uniref:carboxypeptidase-like regulatory domain-containing protein n=1 Tax=Pontimicrobium sp. IMCC45349 TaxID=3391574 RepID=UPI0039A362ED